MLHLMEPYKLDRTTGAKDRAHCSAALRTRVDFVPQHGAPNDSGTFFLMVSFFCPLAHICLFI
jgi:hypothetical protein